MRLPSRLLLLSALLVLAGEAFAAAPPGQGRDAFLDRLAGRWTLVGRVHDAPAHYEAVGRWALADGWLRLAMVDKSKADGYVAEVYFGRDAKSGDYVVHWLDRFGAAGARVVATGQREGDTLVFTFPYADGAFRDTLTLPAGGHGGTLLLESATENGGWSTFASFRMGRAR